MTAQLPSVAPATDSFHSCRLEEEIGQDDVTGSGYLTVVRRCSCGSVADQSRDGLSWVRQRMALYRRVKAKERAEGEAVELFIDPSPFPAEDWS